MKTLTILQPVPGAVPFAKITKLLTSLDPGMVFKLPHDVENVYLQVETPHKEYAGQLMQILNVKVENAYVPHTRLDYKDLEIYADDPCVSSGNFVCTLYFTRPSLKDDFEAALVRR